MVLVYLMAGKLLALLAPTERLHENQTDVFCEGLPSVYRREALTKQHSFDEAAIAALRSAS